MGRRGWWMSVLVALVVFAAACGSGGDGNGSAEVGAEPDTAAASADSDGGEDAGEPSAEADATGDDPTADDAADDGESGRVEITEDMSVEEITELLFPTFDEDSIADQEAQWEDQERQRQQLIAECMAAEGFEYIPVDYGDQVYFGGPDEGIDPSSREWAETYGFGYTTFAFEDEGFEEGTEWVDPNADYVQGLSEGAQEAYYAALYGTPPEFDQNLSEEEFEQLLEENPELFEPQGCDGEAYRETEQFAGLNDVYFTLQDEFDELYERVEADPRIAAFQQDWAECMAAKGHAFSTMDDMYELLSERSNELWNEQDWEDPFAGLTDEEIEAQIDSLSEDELDELFRGPEPDPDLLAEVQEWEIALALDSFDCGGTSQWEQWGEIFAEYQQTFIEENLDTIRASLAEG